MTKINFAGLRAKARRINRRAIDLQAGLSSGHKTTCPRKRELGMLASRWSDRIVTVVIWAVLTDFLRRIDKKAQSRQTEIGRSAAQRTFHRNYLCQHDTHCITIDDRRHEITRESENWCIQDEWQRELQDRWTRSLISSTGKEFSLD